jgi:hypothetical protein
MFFFLKTIWEKCLHVLGVWTLGLIHYGLKSMGLELYKITTWIKMCVFSGNGEKP